MAERLGSRWTRMVGALALMFLTTAPALDAQVRGRRGQQGPGGEHSEMSEAIQQRFQSAVRERLELDDETTRRLGVLVREFGRQRADLARRQRQARTRVRMLGRVERGGAELTEESARAALEELLAIAAEEVELFRSEQAALLEILTPVQLLKLQQLREEMAERLRRMRGRGGPDAGGRSDRPRGGPPGPYRS